MFSILDGRTEFYQWDIDRKLVVEDDSITEVHFCNRTGECSLVCEVYTENDKRLVNVPNILLQNSWKINVYGYDINYTKHSKKFEVVERTKPADYLYTETETMSFSSVLDRAEKAKDEAEKAKEQAENSYMNASYSAYEAKQFANQAKQAEQQANSYVSSAGSYSASAYGSANAAKLAEENAFTAANMAESQANYIRNNTSILANAVKGKVSGEVLELTDVSPLPHTLDIKVTSKNLTSRVLNNAVAVGDKVNNNIFGAAGGRVPKLEEVDAYEENTQYTLSLKVTPKDITYSATGRLMFGTATYTDGEVAYFDLVGNKNCNVEPNTLVFFTTAPNKTVASIDLRKHSRWTGGTITLNDLQIEKGIVATEYTPHIDTATVKLSVDGLEYPVETNGVVTGIESNFPTTTLTTDTTGALINVEYNRDTNNVIESLVDAIISLGGNI